MSDLLEYSYLGVVDYLNALDLQRDLVERRVKGEIADRLLLLEHPPVITQGKRDCPEDFKSDPRAIEEDGISIVRVDRGGRLTYHGPGQLIGYFICDVTGFNGVRAFVRSIEEVIISALAAFGIEAGRDLEHPGVWVGRDKIAAVGLHISRNVSSHGFALNVNCDLEPYRHIVACGISDKGVTTMEAHADPSRAQDLTVRRLADEVVAQAERVLGRRVLLVDSGERQP